MNTLQRTSISIVCVIGLEVKQTHIHTQPQNFDMREVQYLISYKLLIRKCAMVIIYMLRYTLRYEKVVPHQVYW